MKQYLLIILAAFSAGHEVFAQKGMKGLVNAERRFAEFTSSRTVKEGFLRFMDSTGVIFRQGVDLNAIETYRRQNASPGILNWEPVFAIISASGDMGATTGPYHYRAKANDTISGRGTFFSIWRINQQGEWKNIADLGTSYSSSLTTPDQPLKQVVLNRPLVNKHSVEEIIQLDRRLNTAIQDKNMSGWMPYIASDTRLNFDNQLPVTGMLQIADAMQKLPSGLVIATKTGEVSSAGDFAYTYGVVGNGTKKENYMRAWIYRHGAWQVIVQTLKW